MHASKSIDATDCRPANNSDSADQYITLGQAGQIAPGRPSANAIWRWCRKGVQSRSGERVKLQHVRAGGKLYTKHQWVHEFAQKLADADAKHFDRDALADTSNTRANASIERRAHLDTIDRELREAGI